jgi:hypothetical protein
MVMKRFAAIALVVTGVMSPAFAQRGSARGGSAGHSAAGFSGGSNRAFSPSARYSLGTAPQFNASRPVAATPVFRVPPGSPGRRPTYPGHRRPVYGVSIPYSVGWIAPGGFGYAGPGFYDPGDYDPSAQPSYPAQSDYPMGSYPPPQRYEAPPAPEPAPPSNALQPAYSPAPEPETADAVTLVFKDGRPSQEIHNYLLTRSTLYVRDQQRHEIPVDELDLVATQKLNRSAGVEFQLPGWAK